MTREEAIMELNQFSGTTQLKLSANFWTALNMAIKALEQEPCVTMRDLSDEEIKHFAEEMKKVRLQTMVQESCEDAVSRKTVLNTLNRMDSVLDEDRTVETYKELLIACYNDLPPVTPRRKKGKWKKEYFGAMYDTCSECRQRVTSGYFEFNYCPNCGAEMESE